MCGESSRPLQVSALFAGSPPHVWGKHEKQGDTHVYPGIPPHVWGKLIRRQRDAWAARITPTCVGKAPLFLQFPGSHRDHPHMCGESYVQVNQYSPNPGSPPHVWGILSNACNALTYFRIAPTCVGNTHLS